MRTRVAVVGGGAVGLITAWRLSSAGVETVVVEEDPEIGVPERDGGLYSIKGLIRIGLPTSSGYVLNRVRGAVFKSPCGEELLIDAGKDVAIVADRSMLDKMLAEMAEERGAEVICGERVLSVEKERDEFRLKLRNGGRISSKWVVDAEGRGAVLSRRVLGRAPNKERWLPIIQAVVENHGHDSRYVYLYFKEYLPDFFGYLIPINDEIGKVGVAARTSLITRFRKFMNEEFPWSKPLEWITHAIYTGRPLHPWNRFRFIPVGDAAGHVKATTGGGVMMGGLIGGEIAKAIASMEEDGDPGNHIKIIDSTVRELERIATIRRLVSHIPPKLYDRLFPAFRDSGLIELLQEKGDMDLQFLSFLNLLRDPRLPRVLLSALLKLTPI